MVCPAAAATFAVQRTSLRPSPVPRKLVRNQLLAARGGIEGPQLGQEAAAQGGAAGAAVEPQHQRVVLWRAGRLHKRVWGARGASSKAGQDLRQTLQGSLHAACREAAQAGPTQGGEGCRVLNLCWRHPSSQNSARPASSSTVTYLRGEGGQPQASPSAGGSGGGSGGGQCLQSSRPGHRPISRNHCHQPHPAKILSLLGGAPGSVGTKSAWAWSV